jgi:hypothetical protein
MVGRACSASSRSRRTVSPAASIAPDTIMPPSGTTTRGVSRTAEYSAALHLERGEAAVRLRLTRSESSVSYVAAAPRSSAASVAEADGSAKG